MNADDFDDYWVQAPKAVEAPAEPALQIDTIEGVEPLDAQLGVVELKTVPDAIYEPLFGQPSDAPLHTYAILDAAKVPNLPELLEVSGLEHRCLFKGDAYDDLAREPCRIARTALCFCYQLIRINYLFIRTHYSMPHTQIKFIK